jgi:two-component system chemotaxis sensor kinase CheA
MARVSRAQSREPAALSCAVQRLARAGRASRRVLAARKQRTPENLALPSILADADDLRRLHGAFFDEAGENVERMQRLLLGLDLGATDDETLHAIFRCAHSVKGGAASFGLADVVALTHRIETLLDGLRRRELRPTAALIDALLAAGDALGAQLARHRAGNGASAGQDTSALLAYLGALAVGDALPPGCANVARRRPAMDAATRHLELQVGTLDDPARADDLVELFDDIPGLGTIEPIGADRAGLRRYRIVTTSSDDELLALFGFHFTRARLALRPLESKRDLAPPIPIALVFERFPRMLRDLAARLGKQVRLVTEGEATEIESSLAEKVADALTHLVRNACDHGIEPPAQRIARGKPAHGTVTLAAARRRGSIAIEVRDDGRGLDRAKLVAKARERGIDASESMSDDEAFALVFAPGLSTAEVVTEVSGRGVGMDVVKKNVGALGGSVAIESIAGRGMTVSLRLPRARRSHSPRG